MGKCNWCGREIQKGIYYGKGWFPSFYCSNRCLNQAINNGFENRGGKSHTYSPFQRVVNMVILAAFAIPVVYALLDGIISTILSFFNKL